MSDNELSILSERINQLVNLAAFQIIESRQTLTEKIVILGGLGLDRNQIASICGTTPAVVSVRLSEARKPKRAKK